MGGFFGFRAAIAHPHRVTKLVEYSWAMGTPMANVPWMMGLGSPAPLKAMMVHMPINASVVKMMLKQVGMRRAIESGKFDADMLAWCVALMKHTRTLRSETDNKAQAFAARLPNAVLEIVDHAGHAPWIDEIDFCATTTRGFLRS